MFAHQKKLERRSPLKGAPLRNPGQSLDEEIHRIISEDIIAYITFSSMMALIAFLEWMKLLFHWKPHPFAFTIIALIICIYSVREVARYRRNIRNLRLGREGEKAVGQYLDKLREEGYQIFHDIVAEGFNLDHVLIGPSGVYAIETKTISKPSEGEAVVQYDGDKVTVAGLEPDRDPVAQVKSSTVWLQELIEESTGKKFKVRPVILYPGWFIEKQPKGAEVWVLNPKALPAFLKNENTAMSNEDVYLVSYHLSRYVRTCKP